jgi:CheY-like chemotaxis protein
METKKCKILIVDDVPVNRMLLKALLDKDNCFEFVTAVNGKDCIDLVEKEDFDIILMDIQMPIMNGFEASEYIRYKMPKHKSLIPIIAITAYAKIENINNIFDEIVYKPIEFQKIYSIIKKHCNFQ